MEVSSITKGLKKGKEFCLVDLAWNSDDVAKSGYFIFGHKKSKGGSLSEHQLRENDVLGYFRGIFFVRYSFFQSYFEFSDTKFIFSLVQQGKSNVVSLN
jgi:hypothetical protein